MNALRELLVHFGMSFDTKPLENADKKIQKTESSLKNLLDLFGGIFAINSVKSFLEGQIDAVSQLNDLSERLGVSSDELQKFAFAANLSGVGLEEAAQSMQFLNKNLGEALSGGTGAKVFSDLKVAVKTAQGTLRPTSDILADVGDKISGLANPALQTKAAMDIFGRAGARLLPLFKQGSKGIGELYQEFEDLGLLISKDNVKAIDDLGDELAKVKMGFSGLGTRILIGLIPSLNIGIKWLKNKTAMLIKVAKESRLTELAVKALAVGGIATLAFSLIKLVKSMGLVSAEAGAMRTLFSAGLWGVAIAAAIAFAVALEDVYTWLEGGDSLLGRYLEKSMGIKDASKLAEELRTNWRDLKDAFSEAGKAFGDVGAALKEVFSINEPTWLAAIKIAVYTLQALLEDIKIIGEAAGDVAFKVVDFFSPSKAGRNQSPNAPKEQTFTEGLKGALDFSSLFSGTGLGNPSVVPNSSTVNNSTSNSPTNVSQTNQTTINVSGAGSPREVAREVTQSLRDTNQSSLQNAFQSRAR